MSLKTLNQDERSDYHEILDRFLSHGQYLNGRELELFENSFAESVSSRYCVGVSSGTDALYLALKVLDIKPGDEVIVPALSWYSTALAVSMLGANPVFADIKNDLTISTDSIKSLVNKNTKAIIPVHFMGNSCEMSELLALEIPVVEDCSQAYGSLYREKNVGSFGELSCFSLNPMKPLGAMGDAGVITTSRADFKDRLLNLRYCGMKGKLHHTEQSLNFRMDSFQAAILHKKMDRFSLKVKELRRIFELYKERLDGVIDFVDVPSTSVPYGFTIIVEKREALIHKLHLDGVETKIQHDPLMSQLEIYTTNMADDTNAKSMVGKILNLPFYDQLVEEEISYICDKVLEFYA